MSIGPLLPESDAVRHELAHHERRLESRRRAEAAAGIDQADGEDHQTGERDADGRPGWESATPCTKEPRADDGPTSGGLLDVSV